MHVHMKVLTVLLTLLAVPFLIGQVQADYEVTDDQQIYYGDENDFSSPAVLSSSEVFEEIPEWQDIQERDLGENDPEYWDLLREANRKFFNAVRETCREQDYDLAVEDGYIEATGESSEPPEITREVIRNLPSED